MHFSEKFKIIWWAILLLFFGIVSVVRFYIGHFDDFDVLLFIFWFSLLLLPIVSEVSLFGFNIKKDIDTMKNELKTCITEINNQNNYQPIINVNPTPADSGEYRKKVKKEVVQDANNDQNRDGEHKTFSLDQCPEESKISRQQRTQERIQKILAIEKIVSQHLISVYGDNFKQQMKLEDNNNKTSMVFDGLIMKDNKISQIVEIKVLTSKSFDIFYHIALNFLSKLFKFGIRIPLIFIVVSEEMNVEAARIIQRQIDQINFNKTINRNQPLVSVCYFKLQNNEIIEVAAN